MPVKAVRFIADKLRFKGMLAAVAISVSFFVMILSLAISSGFRYEIRSGISAVSGDIQLGGRQEPVNVRPDCYDKLEQVIGVESITPVIWKPGIVKGDDDICGILVKGMPFPDSCSLQARIPRELSRRMKLEPGDAMVTWFVDDKAKARRFTVSEVYDGLISSDDAMVVQVPLSDMQRLCGWDEDEASALEFIMKPGFNEGTALQFAAQELSWISDMPAGTSRDRYPQIFDWLDLIDFNVLIILILMTVVAGFNMISGLLILLFRHISTIGTLKSLGMTNKAIARVFLRVSARLVLIGMAAGNVAALLFCLLQDKLHLIKLNPENYFVSFVPVHLDAGSVLLTDAAAFLSIMLLLLIPTFFISNVDPAQTVRVK